VRQQEREFRHQLGVRGLLIILGLLIAPASWSSQPQALCKDIFSSPIAAHGNDSRIVFLGGHLQGVSDPLSARHKLDLSLLPLSCGGHSCAVNGTASSALALPGFRQTSSSYRLSVFWLGNQSYQGSRRDFSRVSVGFLGRLQLLPENQRWHIKELSLSSNASLTIPAGDYWIENLSMGSGSSIQVSGNGTARFYIKNDVSSGLGSRLNAGSGTQLERSNQLVMIGYKSIRLGELTRTAATLYAQDDVALGVSAVLLGDASGSEVIFNLASRGIAIDDSVRGSTDYGDLCINTHDPDYQPPDNTPPLIHSDISDGHSQEAELLHLTGSVSDQGEAPSGMAELTVINTVTGDEVQAIIEQESFTATLPLPFGESPLLLKAKDVAGNESVLLLLVSRIDQTAPQLELDSPANQVVEHNINVVTVSGLVNDGEDGSGIASVMLSSDRASSAPLNITPDESGAFSAQIELQVGLNHIEVTAQDHAGNESTATLSVERLPMDIDEEPPFIVLDNPQSSRTVQSQITVSGRVTDNRSLGSVSLTSDRYGSPFTVALTAEGAFSLTVPLKVGGNTLILEASDEAGNATSSSIIVERAEPPRLTQLSPASGSVIQDDTVTVSGVVTSSLPADQLRLSINGSQVAMDMPNSGQGYSFAVPGVPLAYGMNRFVLRVSSPDGQDSAQLDLSRMPEDDDNVLPPELTLLAPSEGAILDQDYVDVVGRVLSSAGADTLQVNGETATLLKNGELSTFRHRLYFQDDAESLAIQVVVQDVVGKSTSATRTVYRDGSAPEIILDVPLSPYPQDNPVSENPYRLIGIVKDQRLAGFSVNGNPALLVPTEAAGEYRFAVDVPLSVGSRQLHLEAHDVAGNRTRQQYQLSMDASALLKVVLPVDGSRFVLQSGPITTNVVARLQGEAPGAEAMAISGERQFPLSLDGSLIQGEVELPEADGSHELRIEVRHSSAGLVAAASTSIQVINAAARPLSLIRMVPAANSDFIAPNEVLTFHFSRAIDPEALQIQVRETLHGETYINMDPGGVDFLRAEGYQIHRVHRNQELVPGVLDFMPGRRAATFVADRYYGYGATLLLEISHGEEVLARSQLQVRPLPTHVSGSVADQFGTPADKVVVRLAGRETRTDSSGGFTFGFGSEAEDRDTALKGGSHSLEINPGMKDPRFGLRSMQVDLQSGRHNQLGVHTVPLLNEATGFTALRSGAISRFSDGQLEIDLRQAQLNGPDGRDSALVNPQFMTVDQLGLAAVDPVPIFGLYALQPEGLEVSGSVGLTLPVPKFDGARDWIEDGFLLPIIGLDASRSALVPVGIGKVEGTSIYLQGPFQGKWLDYLGVTIAPEAAQDVMAQWLDGDVSWAMLRAALSESGQ